MNEKILVVDDSTDIRDLLSRFLIKKNFQVFSASNGKEALKYLESNSPDLILLDSQMEVMGGLEFLNELDKSLDLSLREIPIIILSGEYQFIHPRVLQTLRKPVDLSKLAEIIIAALKKTNVSAKNPLQGMH